MKFLHTSDWHLGMTWRGGISYRKDQEFMIRQICLIAAEEQVDGILLAGDIFDKSIASQEALELYDEAMTEICNGLRIPVYLIAGNHDGAQRIAQCSALLEKSGLYIAGALTGKPQKVRNGNVDIYLLPWISTDKVRSVFPEQAEKVLSMEDAYRIVLDRYRADFTPGQKNILVAHAFIVNAQTSESDRAAEVGRATMVSASVFEGFDYVALGHLHGPQQISERIRYSGTPMAYSFGKEEKQEKSVTVLDTDTMQQKTVSMPQLHKRVTLTGSFDELLEAAYEEEILQGYVRLDVTDRYVGMESVALLRERYSNLLEVTGRDFEREDARITMSVDELEQADKDPDKIFTRYCEDILEQEPDTHLKALFDKACRSYEKEAESR